MTHHCGSCWLDIALASLAVIALNQTADAQGRDASLRSSFRRPVAMTLIEDGRWLVVANQRSGTLSIADTEAQQVTAELSVARRLSDLIALPGRKQLVAADDAAGQLILLRWRGGTVVESGRLDVPAAPIGLALSRDGRHLAVASLWSHRVTLIDLSPADVSENGVEWQIAKVIELPFAPRELCFIEHDEKLVVADAFGGRLALLDAERQKLLSVRELPAHNIRGLALSGDGRWLLVAHQAISPLARADREDIHWGTLLRNNLRWLSCEYVAGQYADLLAASRLEFLGGTGNGAADPGEVLATDDGRIAMALSGSDAVLLDRSSAPGYQRIGVGRRPTALAADRNKKLIYVANTLSDSISVIDTSEGRALADISLGPQPELSLADQGELLFYDGHLSHDGWMSCHSCHTDGHTNGQRVDNFTDGSYGDPKRVLSLLGTGDSGPWAWNSSMADLERQVRNSIASTMQGREPAERQVAALVAFVRSLDVPPVAAPSDPAAVVAGRQLFSELDCQRCHLPPAYTSPGVFDVGLADESGHHEFNPPSLRGLSQRDRYFHDNRAEGLADVFLRFHHELPRKLSDDEIAELLAFLRSL